MLCNGYGDVVELKSGELAELRDVRGATLRVTRGTLWVTQDRDSRDVVLRTGDVWAVERDGLTLAEAQGAATFCILGGQARRVSSRTLTTYRQRLAKWFDEFARRRSRRFVPYL
ncbi:MAG: DUF2917 domain-containing protein [Casimicrobiaceae bacterium]